VSNKQIIHTRKISDILVKLLLIKTNAKMHNIAVEYTLFGCMFVYLPYIKFINSLHTPYEAIFAFLYM
jgi:hypothetical protein